MTDAHWPSLELARWQETRATLHLLTQIVGKTRLALAPPQNHWWHVPLYVSARGLTTSAVPWREHALELEFDLLYERLRLLENPEEKLLAYLRTTYAAAATLGRWDRGAVERSFSPPIVQSAAVQETTPSTDVQASAVQPPRQP